MGLFSINNLFTPAPSGVGANPPPSGTWLATMLGIGGTLGLSATAWQSGGIARTMMAILATVQAQQDGIVSVMAQGGFLDFAASGTVQYVNSQGQTLTAYVTPDPSILAQNPTGAPGWLDVYAYSTFNVLRTFATFAAGPLYLTNASGSTYGPYAASSFHVANPSSGASYNNNASLTVVPSPVVGTTVTNATNPGLIVITTSTAHGLASGAIVTILGVLGNTAANGTWVVTVTGANTFSLNGSVGNGAWLATSQAFAYTPQVANFTADKNGAGSTSAPGTITQPVTSLVGVTCSNVASFVGSNAQSNATLASLCRAKLATISPNGPGGAYQYFALQAYALLLAQTSPYTLVGGPITRAIPNVSTATGVVTTTIANAAGAVHGAAQLIVSGATNAPPIAITTTNAHGLTSGDIVSITGVTGNTAANGPWTITVTAPTTFTLNGSVGNGAYVNGGSVEGSDVGFVDQIIQASVVPNGTIAVTQSAVNHTVAVVATIWIPASMATGAAALLNTVLVNYFASLPIGGLTDTSTAAAYANVVPFDAVLSLLSEAFPNPAGGSYVQNATLTLNGGTTNVSLAATDVAVISPAATITVNGL